MKNSRQIDAGEYVCSACGKTYEKRKSNNMECLVKHSIGDCCHFNEREIIKKKLNKKYDNNSQHK